jgi:hypothetical protein
MMRFVRLESFHVRSDIVISYYKYVKFIVNVPNIELMTKAGLVNV